MPPAAPRNRSRSRGPSEKTTESAVNVPAAAAASSKKAAPKASAKAASTSSKSSLVLSAPPSWQLLSFLFVVAACCARYAFQVDLLSSGVLITRTPSLNMMRFVFAISIFVAEAHEVFFNPLACEMTTYKPPSKLFPCRVDTSGYRQLTYFTHWSWLLLGLYFTLALIPSGRFDSLAYVLWEISSANALLVSAVVTFVIWPEKIVDKADTSHLASWPVLMMHNANTLFVGAELLAGTGVTPSHLCVIPLYGLTYVLFLWYWSHVVSPKNGVQFYYFFLDTTLPPMVGVVALAGLLVALGGGFLAVSGLASIIENWSGDQNALKGIVIFFCAYICKWAD